MTLIRTIAISETMQQSTLRDQNKLWYRSFMMLQSAQIMIKPKWHVTQLLPQIFDFKKANRYQRHNNKIIYTLFGINAPERDQYVALPRISWGRASWGLCVDSSPPPATWGVIRIRTCNLLITKHKPQPLHHPANLFSDWLISLFLGISQYILPRTDWLVNLMYEVLAQLNCN